MRPTKPESALLGLTMGSYYALAQSYWVSLRLDSAKFPAS